MEDLLVSGRYRVGDRIPTETELVGRLEVSRATVRAGLARLVERGLLERRQGSGTFLVSPPKGARLRNGLERLETYTVHAHRLGLDLGSRDLRVEEGDADPVEAEALDVPLGTPLAKVSRTLLVNEKPAAWMVDIVPEEFITAEAIANRFKPEAMVLDLLVTEGIQIGFSKLSIEADLVDPGDEVGKRLHVVSPAAALSLVETMYLGTGRPVQWSQNVFLPGHLDLHVVRELSEVRELS